MIHKFVQCLERCHEFSVKKLPTCMYIIGYVFIFRGYYSDTQHDMTATILGF